MTIRDRFDLAGRVTIVTGGAGLLGQEFCRTLGEAGATVVVADVNQAAADRVSDELEKAGVSAMGVRLDVTDPASVHAMMKAVVDAHGRVDVLVNSAAMDPKFDPKQTETHTSNFEDGPLSVWKQAIDVNLTGVVLCCQAAVKQMLAQGGGNIINICSIYGIVGPDQRLYEKPGQPIQYKPAYYSVTKAGIVGLTKYLATYCAGKNIRVNTLTPGGVFHNHDDVFVKQYSARAVLGRMAQKDDMNGALLFLASDASSYMTGANVIVDGGWTAW